MDFLLYILHDVTRDWHHGDYLGVGIGVVAMLTMVGVVAVIAYGIFYVLDTAFVKDRTASGTVTGKYRTSGWTQFINNTDANGNIISVTHVDHPPQYNVQVSAPGVSGEVSIGKDAYDNYDKDQAVIVWYRLGRISGSVYVTGIGR